MENKTGTATAKRSYTRLEFSLEQEELLIDFVKTNSSLFNPKDAHYKNKMYRDRLWAEFGKQIDKTGIFSFYYDQIFVFWLLIFDFYFF